MPSRAAEKLRLRLRASLQRCRKICEIGRPFLEAGAASNREVIPMVANSGLAEGLSCEAGRGPNLVGRRRSSEGLRFEPGALIRRGDSKKRASRTRAAPTRMWSRRSSNDCDNSYRHRRLETKAQRIRTGAAVPSHDGSASQAAPDAQTPAGASSAWLAAGQHRASPSARRPGRA